MKKQILVASLIAIAPVQATELDDLVNTSQNIRDTFAYGIKAIAGMEYYAGQGLIAPDGTVDQGIIDKAKQDAYNAAVQAVINATYDYDPGAQQYFDNQAQDAMNNVGSAIDAYVEASAVLIEVAVINEMAQDAQEAQDERQAMELQEYMSANDVTLEDQEIEVYNDSLLAVEEAAQNAAAYMAVANDETLIDQANEMAADLRVTYQETATSFFDIATQAVWVSFDGGESIQGLNLAGYFVTVEQIINEGESQEFFITSPEGGCWFLSTEERDQCLADKGITYGP